jgi:hypothetical protein
MARRAEARRNSEEDTVNCEDWFEGGLLEEDVSDGSSDGDPNDVGEEPPLVVGGDPPPVVGGEPPPVVGGDPPPTGVGTEAEGAGWIEGAVGSLYAYGLLPLLPAVL